MSPELLLSVRRSLQRGLPLVKNPYQALAQQFQVEEDDVLEAVAHLRDEGLIKRFGLVVRHHELGYIHNGMVVWNISDDQVDRIGELFSNESSITLCYRRPRRPGWSFNLFCMIHGKSREQVKSAVAGLIDKYQLQHVEHDILFSLRRFKQQGGQYV